MWPAGRNEKAFGKAGLKKGVPGFRPDFIAGPPDARPGRGDDIPGIRPEPGMHRFHRFPGDPQTRPLPTGMDGGGEAESLIPE